MGTRYDENLTHDVGSDRDAWLGLFADDGILKDPAGSPWHEWLDAANHDVDSLEGLLRRHPPEGLVAHPVSRMVNSADNDGLELALPLAEAV